MAGTANLSWIYSANPVSSLLTGIVSYWKLDESSGNATDSAGGGNTGTPTSVTYSASGKVNTAYAFNGTTSQIDCGNPANLALTTASISCWVFPTSIAAANDQSIICKANPSTNRDGYNLFIPSSFASKLYFELDSASASQFVNIYSPDLTNSTWYHVVVTFNGTTLVAYVNGSQVLSTAQTVVPNSGVYNFTIGSSTVGDNARFNGTIDEIGVWSRVLTSTEVSTLYNSGSGLAYPF